MGFPQYPPAATLPNPDMGDVMRTLEHLARSVATIQANQNKNQNYSMHNNQFLSGRSREQDPLNNSTRSERWAGHPRPGRAAANGLPMHAAQYPNTADQAVNQRVGALGITPPPVRAVGKVRTMVILPLILTTPPIFIPTVTFLCMINSATSQWPSNRLMRAPSPCSSKRISSGRDRTGNDGVARIYVPWPNEFCLIGIDRKKVRYDQLNQGQWQSGLMNILAQEKDPLLAKHMLAHITKLAKDAVDCGFRLAKGAHAAVLCALEEGRVTWAEPDAIEEIRRDSVSRIFIEAEVFSRPSLSTERNHRCQTQGPGQKQNK